MRSSRKGTALAVVSLGVAGALGLGFGIAQAAPGPTPSPSGTATGQAGPGGMRGGGMWGGGMHGGVNTQGTCLTAAATYLGLSEADLRTQLHSGKTLAAVAAAQGKSESGLRDAMVAAATKAIEGNTSLSADQKKTALDQAKARIDAMITKGHQMGAGAGGMRGFGRGQHMRTS